MHKLCFTLLYVVYIYMYIYIRTCTCVCIVADHCFNRSILCPSAFLQEWHRMANAIHGLGQCFQKENKECESLLSLVFSLYSVPSTHTHTRTHTHTHTVYTCVKYMYSKYILYSTLCACVWFCSSDAKGLNQAIGHTADMYRDIGTMHAQQVS